MRQAPLSSAVEKVRNSRIARVAVAYAGVAFIVLQVSDLLSDELRLPGYAKTLILALLALGFPLAIAIAWGLTPAVAKPGGTSVATGLTKRRTNAGDGATERLASLAVLRFADLSPGQDHQYLSDGITEELMFALSRVSGLRVPARTSSFASCDERRNIRQIGEELGVEAVLEGSVRSDGDKLRISAQLVEVDSGFQVWSDKFDTTLSSIFAVQEQITGDIIEALRLRLPEDVAEQAVPSPPTNVAAYQAYLKGRHCWNTGTQAGLEQSLILYEQALKADPAYARAYAGIADALIALGNQTALDPKLAYPRARTAAQNALRLDPTLADAHASLGLVAFIHDWDLATAGTELHQAVALDPASATARQHLARYLGSSGQFAAAIDQALAAVELDPLSPSANSLLGAIYRMARRFDDSIDQLERSLTIFPDQFPLFYHLTFGYACAGRSEDALGAADSAIRVAGRSLFALGALGYARGLFLGADEGRAIAAEMESASPEQYVCPYDLATIYAACGDLDLAVQWLDKAIDERDHALLFLKVDPALDGVRDHGAYDALIGRLDGMMR